MLAATGFHSLGLGLGGALIFAAAGMAALGVVFNVLVLRRLTMRPVISLIMVTLGLGTLIRGAAALLFTGIPAGFPLPIPTDQVVVLGTPLAPDKLVAAAIAALCVAAVSWFAAHSRTGIAWRAIADDSQAASGTGIDLNRHLSLVWALTGVIAVVAGVLWTFVAGGGFGVALIGMKIFPIVIIGGLDSIPGTIVGAMAIGVVESLGAGYLDPSIGGGFGNIVSYLLLLAVMIARPHGLFGQPRVERV
jgi:branched-chain amino acid transport system permease protein